ncbi:MAG: protein kinase [Proteobacteria bacterium]|nr:protein kinase [Pseudomonadota bacterium]
MRRCPKCHRRLSANSRCPRDGTAAPIPDDAIDDAANGAGEPAEVPGYVVGDKLGSGGFAGVWRGMRIRDRATVALKVAHTASHSIQQRCEREARALRSIGSPHVPELYDRGLGRDGRPFLAMELVADPTLASHLEHLPGSPAIGWVLAVSDAVLTCLEAAHAKGFVHRDLKPENIFLSLSPIATRLIDFGIARNISNSPDPRITATNMIVGTSEYISPEQLAGQSTVDERSDIYSFGIILYELLTLRVPFIGDRTAIEHGHFLLRPTRPSKLADVPEPLEQVCLACLAKDPDRRPPSAAALRLELAGLRKAARRSKSPDGSASRNSNSLLTDARQPVVLLVVDVGLVSSDVHALIMPRKGVVARQWGRRYVCAFSGLMAEDPARSAIAAARDLVRRCDARVALHLVGLKVRHTDGNPPLKVYGRSVEKPDAWLPDGNWSGVLLTGELARALPVGHVTPVPGANNYYSVRSDPDEGDDEVPLIGRNDVLDEAHKSFGECLETSMPGLFTLLGQRGMGKSRMAHAFARFVSTVHPGVKCCVLHATRGSGDYRDTTGYQLRGKLTSFTPSEALGDDNHPPDMRSVADLLLGAAGTGPFALIVDDAHHADDATLDAIEYVTLDRANTAVWIAVTAHPRLERRRPSWGQRANRHDRVMLEPLDEQHAMELATELLRPAEYTPAATLRRLARWVGGNPHLLVEIAYALKREGMVCQRPETGTWYVATAELDKLPPSPVGQWLAAREMSSLPMELASCARLCSVLGDEFTAGELEWVMEAADQSGAASSPVDAAAGLTRLEKDHNLLQQVGKGRWTFRQPAIRGAMYKALSSRNRAELHRFALQYWQSHLVRMAGRAAAVSGNKSPGPGRPNSSDAGLLAVARHAAASGAIEQAINAYIELGDHAASQHKHVDADEHYSAALQLTAVDDLRGKMRALGSRGQVRYHMQRNLDALDDLIAARRIAEELNDRHAQADLLLAEATALDWTDDYMTSPQRVEEARSLVQQLDDTRLKTRYVMALGRSRFRQEKWDEAASLLRHASTAAAKLGDYETHATALLLLAPSLVMEDKHDEAAVRFDEVIDLCSRVGDRVHLAAAYCNRAGAAQQPSPDVACDLERAVELAREIGHPFIERVASYNLAEYLFRSGDHAKALPLARRAKVLQERFVPEPVVGDDLLLARIHAARGELSPARICLRLVQNLVGADETATYRFMIHALDLTIGDIQDDMKQQLAWDSLLDEARSSHVQIFDYLELLYFRACAAARAERWQELAEVLRDASSQLSEYQIWRHNFDAMAALIP